MRERGDGLVIVGGRDSMNSFGGVAPAAGDARATHRHACKFCGARARNWDALSWHVRVAHPQDYRQIMDYASAPRTPANATVLHARGDRPTFDERVHTDEEWLQKHEDDWDAAGERVAPVLDLVELLEAA